jgi:hypothetical protein
VEWSVFKENINCPWNKSFKSRLEGVEDFITTPLRTDMNQTTTDPIAKTDLEKGLLLDFASIKLDRLTLPIKQELDLVSYEELDQLIHAFTEIGCRPDEILFLKSLVALKVTKKNLEERHFFNQQFDRLSRSSVKE